MARAGIVALLAATTLATAAESTQDKVDALALWAKVHQVFAHPRCANCHVGDDNVPMWSGKHYGPAPRPHGMNVNGGASRMGAEKGLLCISCHAPQNAALPHSPPGAGIWVLAPVQMQWYGKTSAEICAQVKDPERNGGRSLEEIAHHVEHDALVLWGWAPGGGRDAAPFSGAQTAAFLRDWAQAGAPCPPP